MAKIQTVLDHHHKEGLHSKHLEKQILLEDKGMNYKFANMDILDNDEDGDRRLDPDKMEETKLGCDSYQVITKNDTSLDSAVADTIHQE